MSHQIQRSKGFIISEFPQFHRVEMRNLPGFFPEKIQFFRKINLMNNHPPGDIRKVKFLSVMSAQEVFLLIEIRFEQILKFSQDLHFRAGKTPDPKTSFSFMIMKK